MLQALLAAIGVAGGDIVNKIILDHKQTSVRRFLPLLFLFLVLITGIILPFTFSLSTQAFQWNYIILFIVMVGVGIAWNVPFYNSIKKESLHEFELIILLSPVMTIFLAMAFLPEERNLSVFFVGILACIILFFNRYRNKELNLTVNVKRTLLAMFFIAIEAILVKKLLAVYSPPTLYFFRTLIMAVVYYFLFRPKGEQEKMTGQIYGLIFVSAFFGVLQMVMKFYGFINFGVIKTTLVLLIAPVLVYFASFFYFREKRLFWRDAISAAAVLACLIYIIIVS